MQIVSRVVPRHIRICQQSTQGVKGDILRNVKQVPLMRSVQKKKENMKCDGKTDGQITLHT